MGLMGRILGTCGSFGSPVSCFLNVHDTTHPFLVVTTHAIVGVSRANVNRVCNCRQARRPSPTSAMLHRCPVRPLTRFGAPVLVQRRPCEPAMQPDPLPSRR